MEFVFDESPWEQAFSALAPGSVIPAQQLLTLLEGADEPEFIDAFQYLEDRQIALEVDSLPALYGSGAQAQRLQLEQQLVKAGSLPGSLEENDPLRLYLEELAATPACGDPELLMQACLQGDEGAPARLTAVMLSTVVQQAMCAAGKGVLLLDLIQEGSLGLWQGILHYRCGDVQAHLCWWIRQYIARAVVQQARDSGLGQKLRQAVEDYRDVDQRLLAELGRGPTLEEMAQALHMQPQEVEAVEVMVSAAGAMHRLRQPEAAKPEEEEDQAVENTAYFQSRQRIAELLSGLDSRQAKLLCLRYGLEGGLPMSPAEAGRVLGMTPEEAAAAEAEILTKLRQQ